MSRTRSSPIPHPGHPPAGSGGPSMIRPTLRILEDPSLRFGLGRRRIGRGMAGAVIRENLHRAGYGPAETAAPTKTGALI